MYSPNMRKSQKYLTRRNFLAGTLGLSGLTGAAIAGGVPKKARIPITKNKKGPIRTKKVPKSTLKYRKKVRSAKKKIEDIVHNNGIRIVSITKNVDKTISGYPVTQLKVYIASEGDSNDVPETVDGIPVAIERSPELTPYGDEHCKNIQDYDLVPGGVQVEGGVEDSTGNEDAYGTSAYKVIDLDNNKNYLLTASHVVEHKEDDTTCDAGVGTRVDQHDQKIGYVDQASQTGDWAVIELSSDTDVSGFDDAIEYTKPDPDDRREFYGWYTKTGIEDLVASTEKTVYQQGIVSGHSNGFLEDFEVSAYISCPNYSGPWSTDGEGIKTGAYGAEGDSGGPYFTERTSDDRLELVGYLTMGPKDSDYVTSGEVTYCNTNTGSSTSGEYKIEEEPTYGMPTYYLENQENIIPQESY